MATPPKIQLTDYELQLDEHARAIGHVCIAWSHMESMLDLMIAELIAGQGRVRGMTLVGECVTSNADIKVKFKWRLLSAMFVSLMGSGLVNCIGA
jgi:hypothetical protein